MNDPFLGDCVGRLADQARQGQISRRQFTHLAAALMGAGMLAVKGTPVLADSGELVFVNWGGDAITAFDAAFGQDFEAATGVSVKQDGSGPTEGAIQAQIESGNPTWDIVDADAFSAQALGRRGIIEPIDYSVVDRSKMRDGFGWEYAASAYFFSYVIAYDATRFGDAPPTGMADFVDMERFPGKRAMYKWGVGMWEALLLADGVAREDLYPLDLERAHALLGDFKENVIAFWGGGAESQNLMLSGEASMALVWSSRARLMEQDSEGDIRFIWNDGLISPGSMAVLKGNPGGTETAMNFIASAQDPARQKILFDLLGTGPANPAADLLIPEDERRFNPVDPANFAVQTPLDMDWYETRYGAALETYLGIVSA